MVSATRLLLATLLAAAACGGGDSATGPGGTTLPTSLVVTVPLDTVLVRESFTASATAYDTGGAVLRDRPVTWSSSDSSVLTVTPGGVVTAVHSGSATLSAQSGTASASRLVTVRALHFTSVATGGGISCGLEATGNLWCWGAVGKGFGNGSSSAAPSLLPRRAAVGYRFTSVVLASFAGTACGIELDGHVACWGDNSSGQLGDGTNARRNTPARILGLSAVAQLAIGQGHACALTGGEVFCWGSNSAGQLGDGTTVDRTAPGRVPGLSGVSRVVAGREHSCALASGGARCWGSDALGELGHDTTYYRVTPVPGGATAAVAPVYTELSGSLGHTCGLVAGAAYCWGGFHTYEGSSLIYTDLTPVPVLQAAGHQFVKLADGDVQCGLESGGDVWCWRFGHPPARFPASIPLVDVAVSYQTICALDANAQTACWQLDTPAAVPVPGAPPFARLAGASREYACGLTAAGSIWCWLAAGLAPGHPAMPITPALTFASIWSGSADVCALTSSGDVWCASRSPQTFRFDPVAVGYSIVAASAGERHTCGLTAAGAVVCWGSNQYGQLGNGDTTVHASVAPVPVAGGHTFVSLASGDWHSCGRTAAGTLYCWGDGYSGQIGDGTQPLSRVPISVSRSAAYTDISGAYEQTCGLAAGAVTCWPWQAGVVGAASHVTVVPAGAARLAAGDGSCALDAAGNAQCWSSDLFTAVKFATPVPGGIRFASVSSGATSCGIALTGAAYCWGAGPSALGAPEAAGVSSSALPLKVYGQE